MLPGAQFPSLVAIALSQPTIYRHVSLLSRSDLGLSPAAERFVAIARRVMSAE